jgi:integrase/recombinase XerC
MWKEKFMDYLRYEKNYSSQTEISYFRDISQFEEFIADEYGVFDPAAVEGDQIRNWVVSLMEAGVKARSVNRKLSAVRSFFRYLKRKGMISHNPATGINGPKTPKKLPGFVKDREISLVIDRSENFADDFCGHRDRFLIELLYLTGIRRAELIALCDSDIDFENCTLRVTGKRNKQRIIPFSHQTKGKIREYLQKRDARIANKSPFLFVKEDGTPLYPKLVYNIIHTHLSSIPTLSQKSPHVLRHSFATEMLNNGADINAVKELLGHGSLASTQIYTHVTIEEMKKTYDHAHPRAPKMKEK